MKSVGGEVGEGARFWGEFLRFMMYYDVKCELFFYTVFVIMKKTG